MVPEQKPNTYVERPDFADGFEAGLRAAADIVGEQDWAMFTQPNVSGGMKSRSWIRNAILRLKK